MNSIDKRNLKHDYNIEYKEKKMTRVIRHLAACFILPEDKPEVVLNNCFDPSEMGEWLP
jgi:hypothetical protein